MLTTSHGGLAGDCGYKSVKLFFSALVVAEGGQYLAWDHQSFTKTEVS